MAGITHAFVSEVEDGADETVVRPSNWNAEHTGLKMVRKAADQIVNNSEVLVNDTHLFFAVGANEIWQFDIVLFCLSASVTPDIDYLFDVPAGAAIRRWTFWSMVGVDQWFDATVSATIAVVDNDRVCMFRCLYTGAAAAGDVQFKWAQHTATAEDTKILLNSHIIAHRLA